MSLWSCTWFVSHVDVEAFLTQTDPVSGILKSDAGAKWQERVEMLSLVSSLEVKVTFLLLTYF